VLQPPPLGLQARLPLLRVVSSNPHLFPFLFVHIGALASSPEQLLRPLSVPAVVEARAPHLNPLSRVHAPLLHVALACGRNGGRELCLGAMPVSCRRAALPLQRVHRHLACMRPQPCDL
jgi:hypothetical protein